MNLDFSRSGRFRGYASIFNSPDLAHDVIMPGAFARSLHRRGTKRVRMLYQHEAAQPIGIWHELKEDGQGLLVEGSLLLDVERAHDVWKLIGAGAIDGLSIGFRTIRSGTARQHGVRVVHEIDLVEISIVTFPMHPQARVSRLGAITPIPQNLPSQNLMAQNLMAQNLMAQNLMAQNLMAQKLRDAAKHISPHF